MTEEPKTPETDDELLLTAEDQIPPDDDQDKGPDDEGDDEEEVVTFGDEIEPQESDSGLVRHLREQLKERDRRLAEATKAPKAQPVEVGPKPTLWDDDIAGDEDKYDAEMEKWRERKAAAEKQTATVTEQNEEQQKIMATRLENVVKAKAALGRPDADEAFENVKAVLGEERAAAIVMIADTEDAAAKLIYALGKHPDKLAALAAQQDPVRFVKEVAKLEGQVKTVKRKKIIEPDRPERGSAKTAPVTTDKKLAKLEAEADRTGDRTELVKYKKQLKAAGKV
jgi:hypothetical protein